MPHTQPMHVEQRGRQLRLQGDGAALELPLNLGGRHRVVVANAALAEQVIATLENVPGSTVLSAGGGLLGAMTVAENLALALTYGEASDLARLEPSVQQALSLCGFSAERIAVMGRERPMHLDRIDRLRLGFVRVLLRAPAVLVLDRVLAGLSPTQCDAVLELVDLFHDYNPFRPVVFVDIDAHDMPSINLSTAALHVLAH